MKQNTIDETGRIVEKERLTHDKSNKWSGSKLVNSRVDKDVLWAVTARKHYPRRYIISSKADCKSAY
eukprot:601487-Ditylum_brightwellii.AAC.1